MIISVSGCSPDHSPPLVSFSRPLRTALLRACSQPHVFLLLAAAHLLAPLVLLASRISLLLSFPFASLRSLSSRPLRTSLLARSASRLSSWGLFTRAFLTRSFATPRSLFKEALLACSIRSFVRALHSLSLSLRSALLRSTSLALLLSCLAFSLSLFVFGPLLSSRLDTPHH